MKYHDLRTCAPKCRSPRHALELAALLSKTSEEHVLLSGLWQCWQCHRVCDTSGRSLLHVASMFGRASVCEWLVRMRRADLNAKSAESGWTPAHCACFYGHLDVLVTLMRLGAHLDRNDHDRLTVVESLAQDKALATRLEPDDLFGK